MPDPLTTEMTGKGTKWALVASGVYGVPQDQTAEARRVQSGKLSVLRKHPYFADLEPRSVRAALPLRQTHGAEARHDDLLKGDPGNSLMAVISGTVKISISSPDGRNAILNLIGLARFSVKIALLDGQPRIGRLPPPIATANSSSSIAANSFPFLRSQPTVAMKFIELLVRAAAPDQRPGRTGCGSCRTCRVASPARCSGSPKNTSSSRRAAPSRSPSRKSAKWWV